MDAEVIVVGAGLAGLTAARNLAHAGASVIVLEASGRLGGRALTDRSGAAPVDLGGQWIGPEQDRILALAAEYGMSTFRSYAVGSAMLIERGAARRVTAGMLAALTPHVIAALPALAGLVRMSRCVGRMPSATADRLDRLSVADWLRARVPSVRARSMLGAAVRDTFCCEPGDMSMLALVSSFVVGGMRSTLGFEGGAQQDLFSDGADRLAELLADGLEIRRRRCVIAIDQERGSARVHVRVGDAGTLDALRSRRVVLAVPPMQVARMQFTPSLPRAHKRFLHGLRMGRVVKIFAIYDHPFWRDRGLSGMAIVTDGPVSLLADVSPPSGPAHLCALAGGRDADALARMTREQRREVVTDLLVRTFGQAAARPVAWREKVWTEDPWAGGGYAAVPTPGTLTAVPEFTWTPVGCVSWAGAETDAEGNGYFDGAVRSGERAAAETLAAMRRI